MLVCSLCSYPYADGKVECKDGVNATRALLVLERAILKRVSGCMESDSVAYDGGVD